jgi:hypothetical protein
VFSFVSFLAKVPGARTLHRQFEEDILGAWAKWFLMVSRPRPVDARLIFSLSGARWILMG